MQDVVIEFGVDQLPSEEGRHSISITISDSDENVDQDTALATVGYRAIQAEFDIEVRIEDGQVALIAPEGGELEVYLKTSSDTGLSQEPIVFTNTDEDIFVVNKGYNEVPETIGFKLSSLLEQVSSQTSVSENLLSNVGGYDVKVEGLPLVEQQTPISSVIGRIIVEESEGISPEFSFIIDGEPLKIDEATDIPFLYEAIEIAITDTASWADIPDLLPDVQVSFTDFINTSQEEPELHLMYFQAFDNKDGNFEWEPGERDRCSVYDIAVR